MKILFLGDVVGISGCSKLMNSLMNEIKSKKIDFVIVNGENAASQGLGLTKEICNDFFNCGVDVITTGNHVWDQKEIMEFIEKEDKLLRPKNFFAASKTSSHFFIKIFPIKFKTPIFIFFDVS